MNFIPECWTFRQEPYPVWVECRKPKCRNWVLQQSLQETSYQKVNLWYVIYTQKLNVYWMRFFDLCCGSCQFSCVFSDLLALKSVYVLLFIPRVNILQVRWSSKRNYSWFYSWYSWLLFKQWMFLKRLTCWWSLVHCIKLSVRSVLWANILTEIYLSW